MSTKLIGVLMILLVGWIGYKVFLYYKDVQQQRWHEKEQVSGKGVDPTALTGLPSPLEEPLSRAQAQGAAALKKWLDTYGSQIQDPRKAWIELDYCTLVARDNPQEARAAYAGVKSRLKENSPVYPRMKQLEKSFD